MSDATVDEAAPARKKAKRSGGAGQVMLLATGLMLLLPIAPATFTIVSVFMAPTFLAICFRILKMPGAIGTVAGLNISGMIPALYELWSRGNDFEKAFAILFDPEFLAINLAAAGMGIALLWISPFVARTWVDIASHRLLHKAEAERKRMLDEWGDDLAPDKEDAEPSEG
jgi:hypothetical protein